MRASLRNWSCLAALSSTAALCHAGMPPVITRHPVPQQALAGSSVSLIGGTSDVAATFQWERDGVPVAGATAARLVLRHLMPGDSGDYQLILSNRQPEAGTPAAGETASRIARVDVIMPLSTAGRTDLTFSDSLPPKSNMRAVIALPGGGCLTGGSQLIKLLADGVPDASFPAGNLNPNGSIRTLAAHGDGWLVGGDFTSYNGHAAQRIVRLTAQGDVDLSYRSPSVSSTVRAISVSYGAAFIGLSSAPYLMKLWPDGTADTDFQAAVSAAGLNGRVSALAVQQDGRILLGGAFRAFPPWPYGGLGRLLANGRPNNTGIGAFRPVEIDAASGEVQAVAVQPNGRVLAGGSFISAAGQTRFYMARFLTDGSLDVGFDPAPGDPVYALAVQDDGKILVGGDFARIAGQNVRGLARLSASGAIDGDWTPPAFDGRIAAVSILSSGSAFAAGNFALPHSGVVKISAEPVPGAQAWPAISRLLESGQPALLTAPVAADPASTFSWQPPAGTPILTTSPMLVVSSVSPAINGRWNISAIPSSGPSVQWPQEITVHASSPGARPVFRSMPSNLPAPLPGFGPTGFSLPMPGLLADEITVLLDLTHSDINDLSIVLTTPGGLRIPLLEAGTVRRGSHLSFTRFVDAAPLSITEGSAPFAGSWKPGGTALLAAARGTHPAGNWTLTVDDTGADSVSGTLRLASLEIHSPAPAFTSWLAAPPEPRQLPLLSPEGIRVHHWPPGQGSQITYQSSTSLNDWLEIPATRVRQEPDQSRQAYLRIPDSPACWFRAVSR